MGWLLSLLTGLPAVFGKLFDYLGKRNDNLANITIAEGQERVAIQQIIAGLRAHDRESLWTAWMVPCAFAISMFHYGAVVFDSLPLLGHTVGTWRIAALPGDYTGMSVTIILSCCGIATFKHLAKR